MRYPVFIEPGTESSAWGVAVPDLPGCYSAGDSLDEALENAEEAAAAWIDAALDAGEDVPEPSPMDALRDSDEYKGWILGVINIDPGLMDDSVDRVNITLPHRVLLRLDAKAAAVGESRSSYISKLTLR